MDLVCSSLTKAFSGTGNVMAGSVALNPGLGERSRVLRGIVDEFRARHDVPSLGLQDAVVLEQNSRSARRSMKRSSVNLSSLTLSISLSLSRFLALSSRFNWNTGTSCGGATG